MRSRCNGPTPIGSRWSSRSTPASRRFADVIADWKKTPGTVGIRVISTKEANRAPEDPGLERILRAAVKHDFPVNTA